MTQWLLTLMNYDKYENNYKSKIKMTMNVRLFPLPQLTSAFYHAFLLPYVAIPFSH